MGLKTITIGQHGTLMYHKEGKEYVGTLNIAGKYECKVRANNVHTFFFKTVESYCAMSPFEEATINAVCDGTRVIIIK